MSVFKVKLSTGKQGRLDIDPRTNEPFDVSKQRTVYVMGPGKVNRKLVDGETFTDCNYWKKFAYPAMPLDEAYLEVVTDDGSVYSEDGSNVYPKVYDLSVTATSTYVDNAVDIVGDNGSYAMFTQITNKHETQDLKMKLNGSAILDLPANSVQVFNAGDLDISKIEFDNSESGAVGPVLVQVVLSIASGCNS